MEKFYKDITLQYCCKSAPQKKRENNLSINLKHACKIFQVSDQRTVVKKMWCSFQNFNAPGIPPKCLTNVNNLKR